MKATDVLKAGGSVLGWYISYSFNFHLVSNDSIANDFPDACEAAIICLENSGETNAGFGSNLTWDGRVECEASIMDGSKLHFGACTNVSDICNPISLARAICDRQSKLLKMDRIPPMVLAGHGASKYAMEINIPMVDEQMLISKKSRKIYDHYRGKLRRYESEYNVKIMPLDTVGAICVDAEGNCAAGCSSGGLILKIAGRIGQAATYGSGCWATKSAERASATCTTGNGEYLMKTLLAREIVNGLMRDDCAVTSLHKTFKEGFLESPFLSNLNEVYGGALSLVYDPSSGNGEVLWSHSTNSLCLAHMTTSQKVPKVSLRRSLAYRCNSNPFLVYHFSISRRIFPAIRSKAMQPL